MKKIFKKSLSAIILLFILFNTIAASTVKAIEPASTKIYSGIDVSNYQGWIDYTRVKEAGIEIVYIKSSEGQYIVDAYFRTNYTNAKANNLKVGFYHFVRARTIEEGILEAEHFAKTISGTTSDCKLAMDFETFGDLTSDQVNEISLAFLRRVKELTGKEMVVYSDTYSARTVFSQELASQYPLWVAEYGVERPESNGKWNEWIGFQYTDRGIVEGINGYVDRDNFTEEILLSDNTPINNGGNENSNSNQNFVYTIRRGDTLSEIAMRYHTTVQELVRINNLSNPNLIFIGETLLIPTKGNSNTTGSDDKNNERYIVRRGDTLNKIATRYGTTINAIVQLNGIKNPNLIYVGEILQIPRGSNTVATTFVYTIKRGDTLSKIAIRYGSTINQLAGINGIRNPNLIYAGEKIRIPINTNVRNMTDNEHDSGHQLYIVKRGDTLSQIAQRYGKTVEEIVELNQIQNKNYIYVGEQLRI